MANRTKNFKIAIVVVAVVSIMAAVVILKPNAVIEAEAANPQAALHEALGNSTVATKPLPPLSPAETKEVVASLKKMSGVLSQFSASNKSMNDLVNELKAQKQEPYLVHDKNPYTGEMTIVRTKTPPTGTRYFHAQYFKDEEQVQFLQHMSFEFRPSPEAMNLAIKAVQEAFPHLRNPDMQNTDFIQWNLEDGQVLWIKRLGRQDIEENPFNGYTESDIGSIRIAVELELEGH